MPNQIKSLVAIAILLSTLLYLTEFHQPKWNYQHSLAHLAGQLRVLSLPCVHVESPSFGLDQASL